MYCHVQSILRQWTIVIIFLFQKFTAIVLSETLLSEILYT